MGKVILQMSVSLDGYMSSPDGGLDWHRIDAEIHGHFNEELSAAGAFLSGRVTWELMAAYWPAADQDPDAPAEIAEFAQIWRDMPKIVYSRTLREAGWNTTILREVVPADVAALAGQSAGDLFIGGADLAATLRRHGLIDEYRIYMTPVILGRGVPLFAASDVRSDLDLVATRTFTNGVVQLRYASRP